MVRPRFIELVFVGLFAAVVVAACAPRSREVVDGVTWDMTEADIRAHYGSRAGTYECTAADRRDEAEKTVTMCGAPKVGDVRIGGVPFKAYYRLDRKTRKIASAALYRSVTPSLADGDASLQVFEDERAKVLAALTERLGTPSTLADGNQEGSIVSTQWVGGDTDVLMLLSLMPPVEGDSGQYSLSIMFEKPYR